MGQSIAIDRTPTRKKYKSKQVSISTQGEWIARHKKAWHVNIRGVPGGVRKFNDSDFGGNRFKSLEAARTFHKQKMKERKKIIEYINKHGERPYVEVRCNNNTGYNGVMKYIYPRLVGSPRIVYYATFTRIDKGIYKKATFSTAKYTEEEAFKKAINQRKEWEVKYGR